MTPDPFSSPFSSSRPIFRELDPFSGDYSFGGRQLDPTSLPKYNGLPDSLPGREDRPVDRPTEWRWADWLLFVLIGFTALLMIWYLLPYLFGPLRI